MLANRSMPQCTVIPELAYPDVEEAIKWLCDAFGFTLRIGIGDHRAQLNVGDGAVVLTERRRGEGDDSAGAVGSRAPYQEELAHSVMVRVDDVDRHHERTRQCGARITRPLADYPYGERQGTLFQRFLAACLSVCQCYSVGAHLGGGGVDAGGSVCAMLDALVASVASVGRAHWPA